MSLYDKQYYQDNKEKISQAQRKYRAKSTKQIGLEVQKEWYEILKAYCDEHGTSITALMRVATETYLANDGAPELAEFSENFSRKKRKEAPVLSKEGSEIASTLNILNI